MTNQTVEGLNCEKYFELIDEFIEQISEYLDNEKISVFTLEIVRLECFL